MPANGEEAQPPTTVEVLPAGGRVLSPLLWPAKPPLSDWLIVPLIGARVPVFDAALVVFGFDDVCVVVVVEAGGVVVEVDGVVVEVELDGELVVGDTKTGVCVTFLVVLLDFLAFFFAVDL